VVIGLGTMGALGGINKISRSFPRPMGRKVLHQKSSPSSGKNIKYGYTDNFKNSGETALLLHGSTDGRFSYQLGVNGPEVVRKPNEFVNDLKNYFQIDLKARNEPIHLLSCYSKNGSAQELANSTNRVVYGYSKNIIRPESFSKIEEASYKIYSAYLIGRIKPTPFHPLNNV
ncbi:hypothetical protein V9N52_004347, partial [Vibrio navarrensis]